MLVCFFWKQFYSFYLSKKFTKILRFCLGNISKFEWYFFNGRKHFCCVIAFVMSFKKINNVIYLMTYDNNHFVNLHIMNFLCHFCTFNAEFCLVLVHIFSMFCLNCVLIILCSMFFAAHLVLNILCTVSFVPSILCAHFVLHISLCIF